MKKKMTSEEQKEWIHHLVELQNRPFSGAYCGNPNPEEQEIQNPDYWDGLGDKQ